MVRFLPAALTILLATSGCATKRVPSVIPPEPRGAGIDSETWPDFVRLYCPVTSAVVLGQILHIAAVDSSRGLPGRPCYRCVLRVSESIKGRPRPGSLFEFWIDGIRYDDIGVRAFYNRGFPEIGQTWLVFATQGLERRVSPGPPGTFGVIFTPLMARVADDRSYVGWSARPMSSAALLDTVRAVVRHCRSTAQDSALVGWTRAIE